MKGFWRTPNACWRAGEKEVRTFHSCCSHNQDRLCGAEGLKSLDRSWCVMLSSEWDHRNVARDGESQEHSKKNKIRKGI